MEQSNTEDEFECEICYQKQERYWNCGRCVHSLCIECYRQLVQSRCPFCRLWFTSALIDRVPIHVRELRGYQRYVDVVDFNLVCSECDGCGERCVNLEREMPYYCRECRYAHPI